MTRQDLHSGTLPDLVSGSIADVSRLLQRGDISSVELTHACLSRINDLNPLLNAFITVTGETALEQAELADDELRRGCCRGPIHGIPISLKDVIDTAGVRTTGASALLEWHIPERDAEVVHRLRSAGAVLLGKTNLHELAYGGSGLISHFGPVRNPRNTEYITGGSSSGSAAAVASHMCFASIGTDTAGSIRLPAAFCGVVGLKPTYGLVSTSGVIPLAWSYDHVGPIARTVPDVAAVLHAIAGCRSGTKTTGLNAKDDVSDVRNAVRMLRVGVARKYFFDSLETEVEYAIENAVQIVAKLGASCRDIAVPVDEDRAVAAAESYAVHQKSIREKPEKFHPETLRRITTGEGLSASVYNVKIQDLTSMRLAAGELFDEVDVVLTPTVPVVAPTASEMTADLSELRKRELLLLRNTRPFNVLGLPAVSVPCGRTIAGLPVGLQIIGPPHGEDVVLSLASAYERETCEGSLRGFDNIRIGHCLTRKCES